MVKESQPSRRKNRPMLRVGAAIASLGLALPACGTGGTSTEPTVPGKSTTTIPGESTTTIPGTTTELPTTTLEPKPTDIIEHRNGYDVLRNGGLLTKVESINVEGVEIDTSWFGGFETHIVSDNVTFGMNPEEQNGVLPKQILLTNLLRAFGFQHVDGDGKPLFVKADGQTDIQAYIDYLKANNWVDPEVYVAKNPVVGIGDQPGVHVPVRSDRLKLDLTKSFIIGNNQLSLIEGFEPANGGFFTPTQDPRYYAGFGINNEGQPFYGYYFIAEDGFIEELQMEHPYGSFPIADKLGFFLQLNSRITYPDAASGDLWNDTVDYYFDPIMTVRSGDIPPYQVLSVYDFVRWDGTGMLNSMFTPTDSS